MYKDRRAKVQGGKEEVSLTEGERMRERIPVKQVLSYRESGDKDKDKNKILYFLLWDLERREVEQRQQHIKKKMCT